MTEYFVLKPKGGDAYASREAMDGKSGMRESASDLDEAISLTIERWRMVHPDLRVSDVLSAIENIRQRLTESILSVISKSEGELRS